jgi:hypothetical protein
LAFDEEEFLTALAMAASEAFFNKLLIRWDEKAGLQRDAIRSQ